ncbi:acyltransferase-domain-containing protein [Gonapodya prolifera JEL478]|uniref:Acyltransferase-domain-containing protein n=1 Tax=Gonapodya prolifera (strain JEL478) TaxID=1344416 RepID=A0A139AWM2_GONPJ|nr:acyltransferase-domain-containing protein [Gonapodya prolifera JEL478]|eukprot:KXS21141.1 acyltransferase-domain-containing protein [Gonapodya prolifera JEL478]
MAYKTAPVMVTQDIHEQTGNSTYILREGTQLVEPGKSKNWLGASSWKEERDFIGANVFYPGYGADIRKELFKSEALRSAVREYAQAEYESYTGPPKSRPTLTVLKKKTWTKVHSEINNLIADMSNLKTLKFMEFAVNNILARMYHQGIHIRESEIIELKKWARKGESEQLSMIFLPSHKSHVDYLVISYVLYRLGIALPHITAGNNLDLPLVGPILRQCGAFFIRRGGWSDTPLYTTLVREYVDLLLHRGHNIEVFIEGTRSRTGKLLAPRFGILKMIQESVLFGRAKDCIIVPLSIGYDNVVETSTYASELLGAEKTPESLAGVASASRVLGLKLGRIDIRFAKPYLLSEFIKREVMTERRPNFNPAENAEHRQLLLQSFGFQVLGNINAASVVMPTALVGTVLLTLRGNGVGREELIRRVEWLRREIVAKGGTVADFGGMATGSVVDRALSVIRDYIGEQKGLLEKVYYAIKPFELSLYRNNVINIFISEAILTVSMLLTINSIRIRIKPDLLDDVSFLSQLLKGEFIYQPGKIENTVRDTLNYLEDKGVVAVERSGVADELSGTVSLAKEEVKNGRETYDLFCFLLWPFVEAYWVATVGLFTLVHDGGGYSDWVDEGTLMARLQMFGKTLYHEGDLATMEAYNKETLKNALARLQEMGVIVGRKAPEARVQATPTPAPPPVNLTMAPNALSPGKRSPQPPAPPKVLAHNFFSLHPDYIPPVGFIEQPQGQLWDLVERIGRYRREGKQRRDNMTVSNRVLKLTRLAAEWKPARKSLLERLQASKEERVEASRDREYEMEMEESEAVERLMMGGASSAKL